jgi:hypothetical protein
MRLARIIERRIRKRWNGVDLATDATAAVAANVGERGATSHASSSQRVVQRSETPRRQTDAENE